MGLTEKPAVCLSALCEASQTLKDTHCIDISGTWYLCGHGTCVCRGAKLQVAPQETELLNIPVITDRLFLGGKKNYFKLERETHLSANGDLECV